VVPENSRAKQVRKKIQQRSYTTIEGIALLLEEVGRPLTAREIVKLGREKKLLVLEGNTPWKTVNARLSEHILAEKSSSLILRSDKSHFALRAWAGLQEYHATRRTRSKFDEEILVLELKKLRTFVPRDGLTLDGTDHTVLLSDCFSVQRSDAEGRYDIVQMISVFIVRHNGSILTYKRSKRLPEQRLRNSYSCFFGGHLNSKDLMPLFRFNDPDGALFLLDRELSEELVMKTAPERMIFKGLFYDTKSEISTQHLGIVFLVDLNEDNFEIGERGFLTDPKFETHTQMIERIDDFENWSQHFIIEEIPCWK
jgi:predicted NUDIX family phosphoesterase